MIWQLKVAPRTEHFIWLMIHGKIKTKDFLYQMNVGTNRLCGLCNSEIETVEHLLHWCDKDLPVWSLISNMYNLNFNFHDGIMSSNWLWPTENKGSLFSKSIIAVTTWLIWKSHCNCIFKDDIFDFNIIVEHVVAHIKDFFHYS